MITLVTQKNIVVAKKIYLLFQRSYSVEKRIIGATVFPPLNRSIADFSKSKNIFYAFCRGDFFIGLIEVVVNSENTHIQSLVVDPDFFKRGVGSALLSYVLKKHKKPIFSVETAIKNLPATRLYEKHGFVRVFEWNTNHGVKKIRFEKINRA